MLRKARAFLLAVSFASVAFLAAGCASAPRELTKNGRPGGKTGSAFYVGSHGWHTSIVIARSSVPRGAWPQGVTERTFRDFPYLEVGWGDRTFYMARRPNAWTALDAVFLPGPSVLHIVGLNPPLENALGWSGLVRMPCSAGELAKLDRALGAAFLTSNDGRAPALGPGLYGRVSKFYPARERYYFANTCNNWTAQMMRAGGYAAVTGPTGTWSAGAVMAQARRLAKARSQAPALEQRAGRAVGR